MFDAEHQNIKEVINNNAEKSDDYKIIAINKDAIEAMLQMKIALNNGEYICFNGDRYVDKNSTHAIDFLGSQVLLPIGPFKIAVKCRVPVVFYYSMRENNRTYRFIFEEPCYNGKLTPELLMEQYIKSLENIVTRYPRQWFNFYDFWNFN
mgnify:FL=1